jgi:inorganic phosphate transporter, PiT family
MVNRFGKGILASGFAPTVPAAIAAIVGAALWVGLATRFGLPVSTTHAIVGSLFGTGVLAYGFAGVNWGVLGTKVALPLLLSPLASLILTSLVLRAWRRLSHLSDVDCLCAEIVTASPVLATAPVGIETGVSALPAVKMSACGQPDHGSTVVIAVDQLHWLTSASASFARGLNDAPKMVALLVAGAGFSGPPHWTYFFIALGILIGSLAGGRRVTTVLAERVTPMNHLEGFIANLLTALLVGPGAALGLPMSTTHVASGAIIGAGLQRNDSINRRVVQEMVLAWVVTLPAAAVLGIIAYELIRVARIG